MNARFLFLSLALTVVALLRCATHAAASSAPPVVRDLGALRADAAVRVGILMRYRHENEIAQLVRMQGDRRSRYYHRFLNNAEWNAYYATSAQTYARTISLLMRRGFRIDRTYADRSMIRATAPSATVERYFGTRLHAVVQGRYGTRYRNATRFTIPPELRDVTVAVAGLDATVHVSEPHDVPARRERAAVLRGERPDAVSTSTPGPNPAPQPTLTDPFGVEQDYVGNTGYGPPIWANAYDFPVQHGYGGAGYAMGSIIGGDYADSDEAGEVSLYDIPRTGGEYRVFTDGVFSTASDADADEEATLDVEVLTTLAPASDFYEYITQYFDELGIEGAYAQAISDDRVATLNASFGACETDDPSFEYATNYLAMQGVAKGMTLVASAGDHGSGGCGYAGPNGSNGTDLGVQAPCADTYVVCVGGTMFNVITDATTYTAEQAWTSGGGGVSVLEPLPDWQASTANVVTSGRNVPDLAMTADDDAPGVGFVIVIDGSGQGAGGTSIASPMFVALQTEIDQIHQSRFGFVTPQLYAVGNQAESFAFHDITAGTNGMYFASSGYDNTTGFGSPLGFELAGAE